jgi:GT2 family glycosyltransferase
MDNLPTVTTVILNWNGLADTRECLSSLRSADYPSNRIVLVDNGSREDEASPLDAEFGDFIDIIRLPENRGFAGGANVGIIRALDRGSDYILLLNNDTVVDPTFLTGLIDGVRDLTDLAAANPKTFFYGEPRTLYSTGGSVSLWRGVAKQVGRGNEDVGQYDRRARRDYADGMCMLIPASVFRKVGLLDEEYFAYWEETDWCLRAREAGLRCYYIPNSRVWHKAARSQSPDTNFHYLYRRNALLFVRKRGSKLQVVTAIAAQAFFYAPLYFLRHPTRLGRAAAEIRALFWHAKKSPRNQPNGRTLI